jgi:hypothetical protein
MSTYAQPWEKPGSVDPFNGGLCYSYELQGLDALTRSLYADRTKDHLCWIGKANNTSEPIVAACTISPFTDYINVGLLLEVASSGHTVDITISGDAIYQTISATGSAWHWLGEYRTATPADGDWCAASVDSDVDTEAVTITVQVDHVDVTVLAIIVREVLQLTALV